MGCSSSSPPRSSSPYDVDWLAIKSHFKIPKSEPVSLLKPFPIDTANKASETSRKKHVGLMLLDATKLNDAKEVYVICREYAGNHSVLNYQDKESEDLTPLHVACEKGFYAIIQILIAAGADVNFAVKTHNATPISQAIHFYNPSEGPYSLRILLACKGDKNNDHDIDVNKPCFDGSLPIFEAARQKKYDCLQALVEAGADIVHAKDEDGQSLVDLALHGHLDNYGPCASAIVERAGVASEEKAVFDMAKTKHLTEEHRKETARAPLADENAKKKHQFAAARGGTGRGSTSNQYSNPYASSGAIATFGDGGGGWGWGGGGDGGGGGGGDGGGGGGGF